MPGPNPSMQPDRPGRGGAELVAENTVGSSLIIIDRKEGAIQTTTNIKHILSREEMLERRYSDIQIP